MTGLRPVAQAPLIDCICSAPPAVPGDDSLEALARVARSCPALREVILRPESWEAFRDMVLQTRDAAHHLPILLLALERGYLSNITTPIHRFLLDGEEMKPGINPGTLKDLREHWMDETDIIKRFERSKGYLGKIVDLGIAAWFESCGWTIQSVDALAPPKESCPDIRALDTEKQLVSVEVKFIGIQPEQFQSVVDALQGDPRPGWASPYEFCDYLMFRAYEAAHQLRREAGRKRAVALVVSGQGWETGSFPVGGKWIQWDNPSFFFRNGTIETFIRQEVARRKKYKDLFQEWASMVSDLDYVWIFEKREDFFYTLHQEHMPATTKSARDYLPHHNPPLVWRPEPKPLVIYGPSGETISVIEE